MWFTVSHNKNLLVFNVPFAFMAETGLWPWDSRSDFLCDKMNQLAFPFGMRLFLSQLFVCDKGQLYKDLNQATTTLPIQAWSIFFSQRFFCHHHCLHVNYLWKWKIRGKNDGSRNLGRGEKGMFAYFLLDFFSIFHYILDWQIDCLTILTMRHFWARHQDNGHCNNSQRLTFYSLFVKHFLTTIKFKSLDVKRHVCSMAHIFMKACFEWRAKIFSL